MHRPPGIIFFTDGLAAADLEAFARRLEELAYDVLLVPELFGREPYSTVSFLLARTERLTVATGIANVYSHHAIVAAQARRTLAELSGGRFVLGLGVSHPPMAAAHGVEWIPPFHKMRAYLDVMEATEVRSPEPAEPAPIWLAAHGPKLLRLASERAAAANTYLMPTSHTTHARELVGPDFRLNVVLPCCLTNDPKEGRRIARKALGMYLPLDAYRREWRKWGFSESDFADGGSDHLIDTLVAWGNETRIRDRMQQYLDAGATQIEVSPFNPHGRGPDWRLLEALAPG